MYFKIKLFILLQIKLLFLYNSILKIKRSQAFVLFVIKYLFKMNTYKGPLCKKKQIYNFNIVDFILFIIVIINI